MTLMEQIFEMVRKIVIGLYTRTAKNLQMITLFWGLDQNDKRTN